MHLKKCSVFASLVVVLTFASTSLIAGEREESILLAVSEYIVSARTVMAHNQSLINDETKGDKKFTPAVYEEQIRREFMKQTGIDIGKLIANETDDLNKTVYALHQAARQVVADAQPVINQKGKGFKGYNPAAFSRMIASRYDKTLGLSLKLASTQWRNEANKPDEFEQSHLVKFEKGKREPVYEETMLKGVKMARYMVPLNTAKGCLGCHGVPVGEKDVAGYPKEGYKEGDLRGAISVMMPVK